VCFAATADDIFFCFTHVCCWYIKELQPQWPREFGKDVSRTSAYGSVEANYIYHAAIGRCRDARSIQVSIVHCAARIDVDFEQDTYSAR